MDENVYKEIERKASSSNPDPRTMARLREAWRALLCGSPGGAPSAPVPDGLYVLTLIHINRWDQPPGWRERITGQRTIRAGIGALVLGQEGVCFQLDDDTYIVILPDSREKPAALLQSCLELSDALRADPGCQISCYSHSPLPPGRIASAVDELKAISDNDVELRIFTLVDCGPRQAPPWTPPDLKALSFLLMDGKYDEALLAIERSFVVRGAIVPVTQAELARFIQGFHQIFYYALLQKGILANDIFETEQDYALYRNATLSAESAMAWCFWAITRFSRHMDTQARKGTYVQQAKDFILRNLDKSFSRKEIADHVHLSQNHLARLFKRETGSSIANYTVQMRMERAMELLENTELSVSDVAMGCGYENYSYFLTLFKRLTGMRPSEYRAQHRERK